MTRTQAIVLVVLSVVLLGIGGKMTADAARDFHSAKIIQLEMPASQKEFHDFVDNNAAAMEHHVKWDFGFIAGYVVLFALYNFWSGNPRRLAIASTLLFVAAAAFDIGEDLAMQAGAVASQSANIARIEMLAIAKWLAFFIGVVLLVVKMPGRLALAVKYLALAAGIITLVASMQPAARQLVQLTTMAVLGLLLIDLVRKST